MTSNPLSSPLETTAADSSPRELHPRNSVAAESESEVGTNEARLVKWVDAILDTTGIPAMSGVNARKVMAVADAEHAELSAEVERYRSESYARIAVKTRLQAERDEALAEVQRLTAENAAMHAEVARVSARCDRFATLSSQDQDHAVKAISERNTALRTIADRDAEIEALTARVERMTYERSHPFGDPVQAADDRRSL